jgi:hypothetical protein
MSVLTLLVNYMAETSTHTAVPMPEASPEQQHAHIHARFKVSLL